MHPLYSIPLFLTSVGVAAFGAFVLLRNPGNRLSRLFALSAASVAFWSYGYGLVYSSADPEKALAFARLGYIGVVFIPSSFCHFVVVFLKENRRKFVITCYTLSVFFLIVSRFRIFMEGVYLYPWGWYPKAGPLYILFILFFYGGFGTCVAFLLRVYLQLRRDRTNPTLYNQVKYVLLAFCVASASFSDYLPNYHIKIYPCAYLAAAGWLAIMAYGTLKYRIIDINLIIRKTIIYSVVTGTLTVIYLATIALFARVFEGLAGYQTVFSSAMAAGLITLCFQPLRKRVQGFVDSKFFRQYVDREQKLYELSRDVVTHTTPEAMGAALMRVLGETLHPKIAILFLRARDGSGFVPTSSYGLPGSAQPLPEESPLRRYFADHPQPFVHELGGDGGRSQETRRPQRRGDA